MMKTDIKLNCLKYGYFSWKRPRNWFGNIKQFFRNLKYAYQRITKGYCEYDTWSLDFYYAQLFYSTLHSLAKDTHGYPSTLSGPEEWDRILKEMAEHFYNTIEDADNPINNECEYLWEEMNFHRLNQEKYEELREKWLAKLNDADQFREDEKNKAFEMMSKHFFELWD